MGVSSLTLDACLPHIWRREPPHLPSLERRRHPCWALPEPSRGGDVPCDVPFVLRMAHHRSPKSQLLPGSSYTSTHPAHAPQRAVKFRSDCFPRGAYGYKENRCACKRHGVMAPCMASWHPHVRALSLCRTHVTAPVAPRTSPRFSVPRFPFASPPHPTPPLSHPFSSLYSLARPLACTLHDRADRLTETDWDFRARL